MNTGAEEGERRKQTDASFYGIGSKEVPSTEQLPGVTQQENLGLDHGSDIVFQERVLPSSVPPPPSRCLFLPGTIPGSFHQMLSFFQLICLHSWHQDWPCRRC